MKTRKPPRNNNEQKREFIKKHKLKKPKLDITYAETIPKRKTV